MNRSFVFAPDHSGAPLADLKRWLSISTEREDQLLLAMLGAAFTACERFTGLLPLAEHHQRGHHDGDDQEAHTHSGTQPFRPAGPM